MDDTVTAVVAEVAVGRRHPVVELFGPTIQGEGPDAGRPCLFVRFGGCDYRCSWCDSMHAVDPATVRSAARRLTDGDIVSEIRRGAPAPEGMLVVLSGGNPAMFELGSLVRTLHEAGMRVSVETQGSLWKEWLREVDQVVVSPKPPSSGMDTVAHRRQSAAFVAAVTDGGRDGPAVALKVVCFDSDDVEFAFAFRDEHRRPDGSMLPLFLSAGTDIGPEPSVAEVGRRFRWLCELSAVDPRARDCTVLPQLHVIAWGNERGR